MSRRSVLEGDNALRIFTLAEKRGLRGERFLDLCLDLVDFSSADLRDARFEHVSLHACDFSGADLRGAVFLGCDLTRARFSGVRLGRNRFDGSWFGGAAGLNQLQVKYILRRGATLLRLVGAPGTGRSPNRAA
jgi:uncharacterized protein YjbI with pentapeptide repeats